MVNSRNKKEASKKSEMVSDFSPWQQIEARVSRIKDYVDNFDLTTNTIASLKPRLSALQECWKKYDQILDLSNEDQDARQAFEETYFDLVSRIETWLENITPSISNEPLNPINNHSTVKLPTINLGSFHGDYTQWLSFRDMFQSLIHVNAAISKIEKFYYLKSCLKGDAANVIVNLEVSSESYETAWDLLRKRYDNNRLIVSQHVRSLFNLPKIDKPNSSSLRSLLECCSTNIRALESLKQPVEYWDTVIIHLVTSKLDFVTLREWENSLKTDECPTWQSLHDFLKHRCQVIESVETTRTSTSLSSDKTSKNHAPSHGYRKHDSPKINRENRETVCFSARQHNSPNNRCEVCKKDEDHPIYVCPGFQNLSIEARLDKVKALGVCTNCLRKGHYQNQCRSSGCKKCGKRHNSALHRESNQLVNLNQNKNSEASNDQSSSSNQTLSHVSSFTGNSNIILLSTVVLYIRSNNGKLIQARALLDSCSQSNFITEHLANMLQLKRNKINTDISGIGVNGTKATSAIHAQVSARHGSFSARLDFLVLRRITQNYPHKPIQIPPNKIPDCIQLADEDFHCPGKIDLLIGAEIFYEVLETGKIRLDNSAIVLQNTKFGWIVTGKLNNQNIKSPSSICNLSITENSSISINRLVERFWTVEERTVPSSLTREERECEDHFNKTVYRNNEGRFVVTLPIKEDLSRIGSTQKIASKRLYQVSKRLDSNPLIKTRYHDFMNEYVSLGHMIPVPDDYVPNEIVYHIPHHAVHKEDSSSTKLRVVFNASTKGTNGLALNDCLMAGPVVQDDIFSITVRFRQHQFVLIADITKMYRQVLITPNQYDLQRIVWWDDSLKKEKDFWLVTLTYGTTPDTEFISRFSTIRKLQRHTAWWLRFIKCSKDPQFKRPRPLLIEPDELQSSLEYIIRLVQAECFQQEIHDLTCGRFVHHRSKLRSLVPFIDASGLLRVGGRLQKAELIEYDQKHPLLLPSKHQLTKLIIRAEHLKLHHAGPQATMASIRLKYWPLNGKAITRKLCHECIICFRSKRHSDVTQLMGNLPMERVAPLSPFVNTGVDYCGPINVKTGLRKNSKLIKTYVAVLVCLSTKAVHLELVHDLTSESFIGALKRFIGRRGKCEKIYSDNATTFTGANKQLQELHDFLLAESNKFKIYNFLSENGIKWVFSPPRAPHHNGLMEAAVKSMKTHLKRVVGNSHLNSEELITLLISIESILNSRPLYTLPSDPNDFNPLTPAHFLIGRPLTATLEPDLKPVNINTLSRWQRIQQLTQSFWSRWKAEYLCHLQNRYKWSSSSPNLKLGTVVLIKEDNVPPLCWPLGRIEALHPGDDGLVRVVTVRSSHGLKKRSITKISPLPMEED